MTSVAKTPVLCVIGPSESGKTRLIEHLVSALSNRGYRLGTAKHAAHGFEIDRPGTDSERLSRSGASMVALVSPGGAAVLFPNLEVDDLESLDAILAHQPYPVDLVLAEGFSHSRFPKIVFNGEPDGSGDDLAQKDDSAHKDDPAKRNEKKAVPDNVVLALDAPLFGTEAPVMAADNVEEIAQFIEEHFLSGVQKKTGELETCCHQRAAISLTVNGRAIPLNNFVSGVLSGAMLGMITPLKGCEDLKPGSRITLCIDPRNQV